MQRKRGHIRSEKHNQKDSISNQSQALLLIPRAYIQLIFVIVVTEDF